MQIGTLTAKTSNRAVPSRGVRGGARRTDDYGTLGRVFSFADGGGEHVVACVRV